MKNLPKIPLAQAVIRIAQLQGLDRVVISPGSRNAPLTIGFTQNEFFKCYSIVDERSAGFFALGLAQQLQKPVILVCTSGSALLNYFPAVAEAYHSNIPLVVLSADRPEHLIGIGDGQTIDQKDVFGSHVLFNANLREDIDPLKEEEEEPMIIKSIENRLERFIGIRKSIEEQNIQWIRQAITTASTRMGPVHLNVPFAEPLYETADAYTIPEIDVVAVQDDPQIDLKQCYELAEDWSAADRKMVLIGTARPGDISSEWLRALAEDQSVLVFTETNSNTHHPEFFPGIDKIIAPLDEIDFEALQPEILLTMGGMVVSKKVKAFLRKYRPRQHWHIGKNKALDTYFVLNQHLPFSPDEFLKNFIPLVSKKTSNYKLKWSKVKEHRAEMHDKYLDLIPFTDFKVFDRLLRSIPDNSMLQVGNSSAIRYTQLFDVKPTLKVFCNRGTSGIDGSTSTATGAAVASDVPCVFITGDLSFFYDSNALWNSYIPKSFRIIVINNGGGGIFRILPGHKNTENFDRYFETVHDLNAKPLCELFKFDYLSAGNMEELDKMLTSFYENSDRPRLLEIFTPRELNDSVLLEYFNFIK